MYNRCPACAFSVFYVLVALTRGPWEGPVGFVEWRAGLLVWSNAWHSPRCQHPLVACLTEASDGGLQVTAMVQSPPSWNSGSGLELKGSRHAWVKESAHRRVSGMWGMSTNVWEPTNMQPDMGSAKRRDSKDFSLGSLHKYECTAQCIQSCEELEEYFTSCKDYDLINIVLTLSWDMELEPLC